MSISSQTFQAETVIGTYGSLVIDPGGSWTYTLDNGAANVQALGAGAQPVDTSPSMRRTAPPMIS